MTGKTALGKAYLSKAMPSPEGPHHKSVQAVAQQGRRQVGQQHCANVRVFGQKYRDLKALIAVRHRTPQYQSLHKHADQPDAILLSFTLLVICAARGT